MKDLVVAITGASGAVYAIRLLQVLLESNRDVQLTISPAGAQVLKSELDLSVNLDHFETSQLFPPDSELPETSKFKAVRAGSADGSVISSIFSESDMEGLGRLHYHHHMDFHAGIASGSFLTDGMVICPCSMGTLASIAHGLSTNLIQRAADVHLKERRKLVVVPRETPLSSVQLENMKRLADAGAVLLPAMPGFYHDPLTIHDLVDFVVGRICDQIGVKHDLCKRWGSRSDA